MPPRTVKPKTDVTSSPAVVNDANDANLRVLRSTDDAIESIVAQSKHCVLYGFDVNTRQWVRRSVEGALFVVRRSSAPRDAFVVLNRAGSENFTREIGGENFELERSAPYLMYRVGREVNGIWFHDQDECEAMCAAFERVMANAKASADAAAANGASVSLRALFASASLNESSIASAKATAGSGSNGVIRVLQPPRKVVGTVAEAPRTRSTSIKSTAEPPPPPSPSSVTPAAVRAALLELIEDDTFIDRLSRAIVRHS